MPFLFLLWSLSAWSSPPLQTIAESSGYKTTGRYEELAHLCRAFATRYSKRVACENFGVSPEGRNLVYMVVANEGALTPKLRALKKRPVLFFQAGIHAGEIDGKDAGFEFIRDVLDGKILKGILSKITLVFIPILNVDGHERFGLNQRPNQNGPAETGWRTTATNLNLNRDYMKADSSEMRDLIRLLRYWDPEIYVDLHVTDGAKFQSDVAILVDPKEQGPAALKIQGQALSALVLKRLTDLGHLPVDFYPSFREEDNPHSGFARWVTTPRFSNGYWAENGRLGVLVETHAWRDYAHRVRTTYDTLWALAEATAANGSRWRESSLALDKENLGGQPLNLAYEAGDAIREIEFRGYKFTRKHSDISGGYRVDYDETKPEVWRVPLYENPKATVSVTVPRGGYLVPPPYADKIASKLSVHGLTFRKLKKPTAEMDVAIFAAQSFEFAKESFEGRQRLTQSGEWFPQRRVLPRGSLFVPIAQPRARLVVHLLEPMGPDSFASWGDFNAHYEKKEYLEAYLSEAYAEGLLKDSAVRQEFEAWQKKYPELAKLPSARLDFFARRHPSWDKELGKYPVWRLDQAP